MTENRAVVATLDVTGCTVEPAFPDGLCVVTAAGTVVLTGSDEELAEVGDALAALARDGAGS